MFPGLDPFRPPDRFIDAVAARMVEDDGNPDHPDLAAGYTYFGQFVDHDITFDPTSSLSATNDPSQVEDFRTPRLDLDSVYGTGPRDMPYLYAQRAEPVASQMLLGNSRVQFGEDFAREDLPRNVEGRAVIGDPRNDENLVIAQLHLAFLKFHNRVIDVLLDGGHQTQWSGRRSEVFWEAQRIVRWHYQWLVMQDYLPRILPDGLQARLTAPRSRTRPARPAGKTRSTRRAFEFDGLPFMPIEFAIGAYRFGHSLVRPSYQLNSQVGRVRLFATESDRSSAGHLGGFRPLPARLVIDWRHFLPLSAQLPPQPARRLDTKLAGPLSSLPPGVAPPGAAGRSLAWLNLKRGKAMGLPSGQDVARCLGITPLDDEILQLGSSPAPLWYYVLAEAATLGTGRRLGPVGGAIVGEVIFAILAADPASFWRISPTWTPFLGSEPEQFTLPDLITYASS
jgi:Animal haem peroxidase